MAELEHFWCYPSFQEPTVILLGELHEKFKRGFQPRIPCVSPAHWRVGCIWLWCSENFIAVNQSAGPPCLQRKLAFLSNAIFFTKHCSPWKQLKKCIHAYLPVKPGFLWVWFPFLSQCNRNADCPFCHSDRHRIEHLSGRAILVSKTLAMRGHRCPERKKIYLSNLISSQWLFREGVICLICRKC